MTKNLPEKFIQLLDEYKQTASVLREILPEEKLHDIEEAIERLENMKVSIAVFGEVNSGKSSLLNALFGYSNSKPEECLFKASPSVGEWSDEAEISNGEKWKEIDGLEIIIYDTPGIARDFIHHLEITKNIANNSDLILFVAAEQNTDEELRDIAMKELVGVNKPLILVINKIDIQRPNEVDALINNIKQKIDIKDENIVRTSGYPINGEPILDDLIIKITTAIVGDKLNLINNTLKTKNESGIDDFELVLKGRIEEEKKARDLKLKEKEYEVLKLRQQTEKLVKRYAAAAAASAAAIPFGLDALTSTIATGGLFYHLAKKYSIEINSRTSMQMGKELISAFNKVLFVSGATFAAYYAISKGAKTNPFTYAIGMALDGIFTYFIVTAIGNTFNYYCANNMTWGAKVNATNALKDYIRENIKEMFIDKLPKRYRSKVIKLINPDLID